MATYFPETSSRLLLIFHGKMTVGGEWRTEFFSVNSSVSKTFGWKMSSKSLKGFTITDWWSRFCPTTGQIANAHHVHCPLIALELKPDPTWLQTVLFNLFKVHFRLPILVTLQVGWNLDFWLMEFSSLVASPSFDYWFCTYICKIRTCLMDRNIVAK